MYNHVRIKKYLAMGVLIAFCVTTTPAAAQTPQATGMGIVQRPINDFIFDPSKIEFPFEYVAVQDVHQGQSGKLIIHIQDAHANLSGQQSLSKTLEHLMTRYDLRLILVEGSARDSTLNNVRKLAPLKDWRIIARRLLFDGIISGEEYLNLTTDLSMKIIGVEYQNIYDDSIRAYAALLDQRKDILHYLYRAENALERLKYQFYPEMLLEYEASHKGKRDYNFKERFESLMKLVDQAGIVLDRYPEVQKLEKLQKKETALDFGKINLEQGKLLKALKAAGERKAVHDYAKSSRRLRNIQVSQYMLLRELLKTAEDQGFVLEEFPEILAFERYLKDFAGLELVTLLNEMELLEDMVYQGLLESEDAKKIWAIDRFIGLLGQAYQLKMSSKDFALLRINEEDFPTDAWLAFMNQNLAEVGFFESMMPYKEELDNARSSVAQFYNLVDLRDEIFVQNAKRIMEQEGQKAAVLIAGGYHTAHLTELFKEDDISYVVLTPVVTAPTDHEQYEAMLLAYLADQERSLRQIERVEEFEPRDIPVTKMPRGLRDADAKADLPIHLQHLDFLDGPFGFEPGRLRDQITKVLEVDAGHMADNIAAGRGRLPNTQQLERMIELVESLPRA